MAGRQNYLKRILDLAVFTVIATVLVYASMFGWRFGRRPLFVSPVDKVLSRNLESHVRVLSAQIGDRSTFNYRQLQKAADYISGQFSSFGYQVEFQEYEDGGKIFRNIVASKAGVNKPDEVVIAGAHYDSCLNPGADDNASGVSVVLELARYFSRIPSARTLRFIAFVNEEPPFFGTHLTGSKVYARAARQRGEKIKSVLIFEMLGYFSDKPFSQRYPPVMGLFFPNRGDFISVIGNFPSFGLVREISALFKKNAAAPLEAVVLPSWVPGVAFSDNYSFWLEGYPAVMLTDTAFYRNPNYHKHTDTFDTLDYGRLTEFVSGFRMVLAGQADGIVR